MIIGIDTRIATKNKAGMAYMLNDILPYLVRIDKEMKFKFFGSSFGIKEKNVRVFYLPRIFQRGVSFFWKTVFLLPANILLGRTDIFLFPNFTDFPVLAGKKILMIGDLSYIRYPQFTEKKNLRFLVSRVPKAIRRSYKIVTISENAKREICEYYGVAENKVEVIYLGPSKNINRNDDAGKARLIKDKFSINKEYILFVGTLEPRKNLEGLIRAYRLLDQKLQDRYQLVLCGGKGWFYDKIFDVVKELGLEDKVVFTGYMDDGGLSSIYNGASLFVFPSFYEGFGMPVLEAFKCGVPVVCAHNSSLPEVAGEAAIYCNADDIVSITGAMTKVLTQEKIRSDLIEKGFMQLKKFSWEDSANRLFKILTS